MSYLLTELIEALSLWKKLYRCDTLLRLVKSYAYTSKIERIISTELIEFKMII